MLGKFFRRTPPLKDALNETIIRLNQQKRKLDLLNSKLKSRRSTLFNSCTEAIKCQDIDRAKIFANELTEVKKVHKTVSNGLLLLEQLILRMETMREIGSTFAQIQPTLEVVKNISEQLSEVMPEVSNELSHIGSGLDDAMMKMNIGIDQGDIIKIPDSINSDEILDQASRVLKEKIEEELPTPPTDMGFSRAIVIGGDEGDEDGVILRKPAVMLLPKTQDHEPLGEDALLKYLKNKEGNFVVKDCSASCKIPENELAKVIEGLSRKGLIRILTVQGAIANDGDK